MVLSVLISILSFINLSTMEATLAPSQKKKALTELKAVLKESQKFVKAHAAEYLIWTGHHQEALNEFLQEEKLFGNEPKYRIVIWRVLMQAEQEPERKKIWLDKIYKAYQDMNGPDRTHATETLAKLKQPVANMFPEETRLTLQSADRYLQAYALWASSFAADQQTIAKNRDAFLEMALTDTDINIRKISAFVLRQSKGLSLEQWNKLTTVALQANISDPLYVVFLTSALVTVHLDAENNTLEQVKEHLLKGLNGYTAGQRTEVAQALAEKGNKDDLKILQGFLTGNFISDSIKPSVDEVQDLKAASAYAILKIKSR